MQIDRKLLIYPGVDLDRVQYCLQDYLKSGKQNKIGWDSTAWYVQLGKNGKQIPGSPEICVYTTKTLIVMRGTHELPRLEEDP